MKRVRVFLIVIFLPLISMAQLAYEVKSVKELLEIIEKFNLEVDEQLDYNLATVYRFQYGVILVPGVGQEGILFKDEKSFKEMVESRKFPVKPSGSIFEDYSERIKNIESNVGFFVKLLSDTIGVALDPAKGESQFNELSEKINQYGVQRWEQIAVPLGIYIAEALRLKIKGKWKLDKEYTLNMYWIPDVTDDNKYTYNLWKRMYDEFLKCIDDKRKFDLGRLFKKIEVPIEKFKM